MNNRHGIRMILYITTCLLLLTACHFQESEMTGKSIDILDPNTQEISIETIIKNSQQEVHAILPRAYLSAFSFTGQCQDLPKLHGQVHMTFVQVRSFLFYQQVVVAFVSVDTVQETLEIQTQDLSHHYWSTESMSIQEASAIAEVAEIAYQHLTELGIEDCDVTLSSMNQNWHVLCTEPNSGTTGARLCTFWIDASAIPMIITEQ